VAVTRNIEPSLRRVAETGQRDAIALQRYDTEDPGRHGVRDERYWSWINAPIVGPDGRVALLLHRQSRRYALCSPSAGYALVAP
jgi:hypothetical protein